MKVSFTFKHIKPSPALEEYAQNRLDRMDKYAFKPLQARFIFGIQRHVHTAEIAVTGEHGRHTAIASADSLHEAVDFAVDKLERQLSKRKEKVQHHKRKWHREQLTHMTAPEAEAPDAPDCKKTG